MCFLSQTRYIVVHLPPRKIQIELSLTFNFKNFLVGITIFQKLPVAKEVLVGMRKCGYKPVALLSHTKIDDVVTAWYLHVLNRYLLRFQCGHKFDIILRAIIIKCFNGQIG